MKQVMTGWQWHQLDHTQIVCTSLQTDSHASISSPGSYKNSENSLAAGFHPESRWGAYDTIKGVLHYA